MQKVFTVYDSKSESYDRPWTAQSLGIALRSIMDVLKDTSHPFSKWPADFTLFEIGEYDEHTGSLMPYHAKINRGVLLELRENTGNTEARADGDRPSAKIVTPIKEEVNHVQ